MGLGLSHVPHLALSWPLPLMALLDPVHVLHIMSVRMDSIRMDSIRILNCILYCFTHLVVGEAL